MRLIYYLCMFWKQHLSANTFYAAINEKTKMLIDYENKHTMGNIYDIHSLSSYSVWLELPLP